MTNKINVDVMLRGIISGFVEAPFDEAKEILESEGYRIISLAENAQLRMQEGANSPVSKNGNYVMENGVYVPKKGVFLTRKSPIMANAKQATQCHREGNEFYLTNEQVEEALSDSVKITGDSIPTNRFGENEITAYAFRDKAEAYGEFLVQAGIKEMPVWLADVLEKPFARQMSFCRLGDDYGSGLCSCDRYLYYGSRVRGIKNNAEGTQKNFEGYTQEDLALLKEVRKENLAPKELEKILIRLEQRK